MKYGASVQQLLSLLPSFYFRQRLIRKCNTLSAAATTSTTDTGTTGTAESGVRQPSNGRKGSSNRGEGVTPNMKPYKYQSNYLTLSKMISY